MNEQRNVVSLAGYYSPPGPIRQGGGEQDLASRWRDQLRISAPAVSLRRSAREAAKRRRDVALQLACAEAAEEDWDGYGAAAVEASTRQRAQRFLDLLPTELPDPEVAAHPDGAIAFEWHPSRETTLVVSVPGKGDLAYAGVSPEEQSFGTLVFGSMVPRSLFERLRTIYSGARSPLSAAGA